MSEAHLILGPDEEPPIEMTPKAVEMVKEALKAEKLKDSGLRVFVQGGGCAGFSYGLDFEKEPRAGDLELEIDGIKVFIDPISVIHLEGTTIDYVMGISGNGFKFNNPLATSTCGCGASFST